LRILLGVCGSISAYKSLDLARGLINSGHQVKVLLTKGAEEFVRPQVFRYLGALEVYSSEDDFNYPKFADQGEVLHIELAQWAQRFVVAPLSANTLARLAMGQANDLLSSVFLALKPNCPVIFFPAMNSRMLEHPIVRDNRQILERLERLPHVFFAGTKSGKLACGEEGQGKLLDVDTMVEIIPILQVTPHQRPQKILITTGATCAPLDPVRYLTNPSSGRTGKELACYFHFLGHDVTLVHGTLGPKSLEALKCLPRLELIQTLTAKDMYKAVDQHFDNCDLFISAAAVGDIEFETQNSKLKKSQLHEQNNGVLKTRPAVDILAKMIERKSSAQKIIGFAAETELTEDLLKEKLERKPVDLLIGTQVHSAQTEDGQKAQGFQAARATYKILKNKQVFFSGELDKKELAEFVAQEFDL
jgi:phosphopantothenoylcysteine decarboxylase/phosphopantothenate--cysteine ligase